MDDDSKKRLSPVELYAFFDRLFPSGFAGPDVVDEIAPAGWAQSPLVACFHPSVEQRREEAVRLHRNLQELLAARAADSPKRPARPEPTLEEIRREYQPESVRTEEEIADLVGLCLWDIFSDNHDVIAADGRAVDLGSFRSAGAFLDEYLSRNREGWSGGDYMRFYMGTWWIGGRADLTPVYAMIFRRLRAFGADWVYHFPELYLVEFEPPVDEASVYSVAESAARELNAQKRRAEVAELRADMEAANGSAREEALDQPPPPTVGAYRHVYGRDPRGWPPA